jgi:hypothetical protein
MMKKPLLAFVVTLLCAQAVLAEDPPPAVTASAEQAQARQFGMYFGGTASQYDLCAKKGFLPKANQSAEEIAKSMLEKMPQSNLGADQMMYIQAGWDAIKKEISQNESFFTQEKCTGVGKEWAKIMAARKQK